MADDNGRTEAAIRARIDFTRNRMGETIEEIGAHLNPDHLKHEFSEGLRDQVEHTKKEFRDATIGRAEELMHNVEETVNHTSRTLRDTIRDNPIPAAMASIGIGWLIADARSHAKEERHYYAQTDGWDRSRPVYPAAGPPYAARQGYGARPAPRTGPSSGVYADVHYGDYDTDRGPADRVREKTGEVKDQARSAANRARETASELGDEARGAADRAQEVVSETADRAQRTAAEAADWAQDAAHRAWENAEYRAAQAQRMAQSNPLAAGAVAMALGFAAGMIIPETPQENRLMGPTRDRLMDRAEEMAHRTAEKVERVVDKTAEEAGSTARKEADREGLTNASSLKL